MAKRRIIFVTVIFLSIAVFSVKTLCQTVNANRTATDPDTENSKFIKKIAESINIDWRTIEYEKTLYNPALTSNTQGQTKAESLFISCEIRMPDSGLILTTCPDVVIEQITDSQGSNITPLPSRSTFRYIHQPRSKRGFMPEGQLSKPDYSHLWVELDDGLPEYISGEIGLKGYFYALVAESLEYVELSFEPNDNWVSITPDVEIRVSQAWNEASMYRFKIEKRPEAANDLFDVQIGDYLPNRLVVDQQIIIKTNAVGASDRGASGRIGGTGSGTGRAEKIRFTIAVNPTHQKIPFELEQIPLSAFAEPATSQTHTSNQTELTPVKRMSEQVKPQFNKKVADCFKVNWNCITYSMTLYNPEDSPKSKVETVSEKLLVLCPAEILDPELIVGTTDVPVIEQITDSNGQDIDISRVQPRSSRLFYHTLRYGMNFSPPSGLLQWEMKARLALGLPLKARHRPKPRLGLQPVRLFIQLDPGLLRQDIREIGSIKGYFNALTAESIKHVKIPFKSSDKWVRLTSDTEIQVSNVLQIESSSRFEIKQRGQGTRRGTPLCVGDNLPDEIVVDRQFIGSEDHSNSLGEKGGRQLPVNINGSGSIGGCRIKKIDFLIAVDSNHNRIPFELEHIPLPKP